jgi:chaperone BCS1
VEKLDPALIRTGRMDKHVELSYCCFEAFKVLVKNYLDIDSHDLFDEISDFLEVINMTPADVAENLMPKSVNEDVETSLKNLIKALEKKKMDEQQQEDKEDCVETVEDVKENGYIV